MHPILIVLSALGSLAAAILAFIFIIPADKVPRSTPFILLHDFLTFKYFIIEKIMHFLYVLSTAFTIIGGFFYLFTVRETFDYVYRDGYYDYWGDWVDGGYQYVEKTEWIGYLGFLIMILGPIVVRLVYELIMMALVTVKNIGEINRKMPGNPNGEFAPYATPSCGYGAPVEPQAPYGYAPEAPQYGAPAYAPAPEAQYAAPEYQAPAAPQYGAPAYAPAPEAPQVTPEISINI